MYFNSDILKECLNLFWKLIVFISIFIFLCVKTRGRNLVNIELPSAKMIFDSMTTSIKKEEKEYSRSLSKKKMSFIEKFFSKPNKKDLVCFVKSGLYRYYKYFTINDLEIIKNLTEASTNGIKCFSMTDNEIINMFENNNASIDLKQIHKMVLKYKKELEKYESELRDLA